MIYDVSCWIYAKTLRVIYSSVPGGPLRLLLQSSSSTSTIHRLLYTARRSPTIATTAVSVTATVVLTFSRSSTFHNSIKSVSLHFVREFYIELLAPRSPATRRPPPDHSGPTATAATIPSIAVLTSCLAVAAAVKTSPPRANTVLNYCYMIHVC